MTRTGRIAGIILVVALAGLAACFWLGRERAEPEEIESAEPAKESTPPQPTPTPGAQRDEAPAADTPVPHPITPDQQRLRRENEVLGTVSDALDLGDAFLHGGRGQQFSSSHVMLHLPEYPGVADAGAANHHAIHTVAVFILHSFLGRINVAVAEDGDADAWVFLDFGNQAPVGVAFVHLHPRAAVNRQRFNADVLQAFGYVAHGAAADPAAQLDTAVTVDGGGIVHEIAVSWGTWTYTVTYSRLGATSAPVAPEYARPLRR